MPMNIIIPSKYFKGSGMNSKKTKLSPNFQRCFMYLWLKGFILFSSFLV